MSECLLSAICSAGLLHYVYICTDMSVVSLCLQCIHSVYTVYTQCIYSV